MPVQDNTQALPEKLREAKWIADLLPKIVEVFDTAARQLDTDIAAVDLLSVAESCLALSCFDDHNALARGGSMWHSGMTLAESGDRGAKAIGVSLQVRALADAPELLPVLVQRLHDRLRAALLDEWLRERIEKGGNETV